jgi:hypothetical protein
MSRKRIRAIIVGVVAVAVVVGVTGAALAQPARKHAGVTLTLWHNYGTEGNAVATKNLVAAFEKANPDITIKVVSQPAFSGGVVVPLARDSSTPGYLLTALRADSLKIFYCKKLRCACFGISPSFCVVFAFSRGQLRCSCSMFRVRNGHRPVAW